MNGLLFAIGMVLLSVGATAADSKLKPVTVCEVLENLPQYEGKTVAVVGRLSSNIFDGAWLSEGGCSSRVAPGGANWPYAIFLACLGQAQPPKLGIKLSLDEQVLQQKLDRLRKTTILGYQDTVAIPDRGKGLKKTRQKETWSIVYGRISAARQGESPWFGAVHARAQLCAAEGARVDIEEPDSQHPSAHAGSHKTERRPESLLITPPPRSNGR